VNLEYLASVMHRREEDGDWVAYPDTLVGTDSHTTMINGLGVVGWGVGGIEAEAVLLGQPYYMLLPEVVGVKITGSLPEGATATDLVLRVTELLRAHGVVGRFVEFYGQGLSTLPLPDRATIANMAPEYGATIGFFPVDEETLRYLEGTGRDPELVKRVETISREMGLFRTDDTPDPEYTATLELDLGTIRPSVAGPRRPQDRVVLSELRKSFQGELPGLLPQGFSLPDNGGTRNPVGELVRGGRGSAGGDRRGRRFPRAGRSHRWIPALRHHRGPDGDPRVAHRAGRPGHGDHRRHHRHGRHHLVHQHLQPLGHGGGGAPGEEGGGAGLTVKPWVKTSMAPGSKVVTDYLETAGSSPTWRPPVRRGGLRMHHLHRELGAPPEPIAEAIQEKGLVAASVLSGNRNFEARIHPLVRANYLASPMLVVAFSLAGRVDVDLDHEPLGQDGDGNPVYLRDIWPSQQEIRDTIRAALKPEMYVRRYAEVFEGDDLWQALPLPEGDLALYEWDDGLHLHPEPSLLRGDEPGADPRSGRGGGPGAGRPGAHHHHGPHLPRGRHPQG
jgi:aconitate hydratase